MGSISDEIEKKVEMVPKTWHLIVMGDRATQTMPMEWMDRGWIDYGNEKEEEKEIESVEEEEEEMQVEYIKMIEESEEDREERFEDIRRERRDIYGEMNQRDEEI